MMETVANLLGSWTRLTMRMMMRRARSESPISDRRLGRGLFSSPASGEGGSLRASTVIRFLLEGDQGRTVALP